MAAFYRFAHECVELLSNNLTNIRTRLLFDIEYSHSYRNIKYIYNLHILFVMCQNGENLVISQCSSVLIKVEIIVRVQIKI